jgi:hypothetical protein
MSSRRSSCTVLLCALIATPGSVLGAARIPADESPAAYAIAARLVFELAPPELHGFYAPREAEIIRAASPVDASPSAALRDERAHAVRLDAEAAELVDGKGEAAARRFPRRQDEARELAKRLGDRSLGDLPWALRDAQTALSTAFRSADAAAIVSSTAEIIHLATDAALPLNTTRDPQGHETGHLAWSEESTGAVGQAAHHGVRARWHGGVITRARARLEEEAAVSPSRLRPTGDAVAEIFATLLRSREACELIWKIDAELMADLHIADAHSFAAAQEDFYRRAIDRGGWIMEARIEDGALLAAGLIVHAWNQAGSPALVAQAPAAVAAAGEGAKGDSPPLPPPGEAAGVPAFAASKKSKTYHRAGCAHLKRISPENLRAFGSAKEAVEAGFEGCKSCKPSGS